MIRPLCLPGLLFLVSAFPLAAQTTFWLRNTDPTALFDYWTVPDPLPARTSAVLAGLSLAPGGRHPVVPGERVRVTLPENHTLVGVFVPWSETPSLRSGLSGGLILASEAPSQGTLLVDRPSFHASNRGRFLEATLQEWGIVVPRFVLDGRSDDWTAIPALIEWGSSFVPKEGAWSAGIPRPRALQAVDREGALWIRFTFESKPFPQGASAFLLIRRPGATIGWPWSGEDLRVFSWNANPEPLVAGSLRRAEGVLEAMIPWDRFPPAVGSAWTKVPSEWVLEISGPSGSQAYTLGSLVWGDLP